MHWEINLLFWIFLFCLGFYLGAHPAVLSGWKQKLQDKYLNK